MYSSQIKNNRSISMIVSLLVIILFVASCDKDNYEDPDPHAAEKYTLSLKSNPDEAGVLSGGGLYAKNETADLNAVPKAAYQFLYWTRGGSVESYNASLDFVMPAQDIVLVAHFKLKDPDPDGPGAGVNDALGNFYPTRIIGGREWMVKNLRTTKYNDGEEIPYGLDSILWITTENPAFCWYNNDYEGNNQKYGVLYNWHVIETGRLCPENWEVPTDEDWKVLEGVADSEYFVQSFEWDKTGRRGFDAGSQLAHNSELWEAGNLTTHFGFNINSYFSALPAGRRMEDGSFVEVRQNAYLWTRSKDELNLPWYREISKDYSNIYRGVTNKNQGFSVRCIKSIK